VRVLETLGRAFTSSLIGMGLLDLDGRWLEVNPALCRLLGRSPEALLGHSSLEHTHPDDFELSRPTTQSLMSATEVGQADAVIEKRYLRADGSVVWARVAASLVYDDDGRPEAVFAQIDDITARRQTEELLRLSDERFERVFEAAPVGMSLHSADPAQHGRILRVNQAFCDILRRPLPALIDRPAGDLLHPDDVAASQENWRRLLSGETDTTTSDLRYQRGDGTTMVGHEVSSLVCDPGGRPLYVVTQVQDIDARQRGERLLREAERRFRAAFEDAGLPMSLYGTDRRIVKVNRALCEMLGYTEAELLGRDATWFVHGGQLAGAVERITDLLRPDTPDTYRSDTRCRGMDGRSIWAHVTSSLIRDDDGEPQYVVSQIEDVSAERAAQELAELRMAQQTAVAWLGQRALSEEGLDGLFEAAVGVLAATCDVPYAALASVQPDGRVRLQTAVGWQPGGLLDPDPRRTHIGFTLQAGGPVIVEDTATEDRFDTDRLVSQSVASGMSVVIGGMGDAPFGVLSLHSAQRRAFSTDDIAFLSSVANVLTSAIRRDVAARDLLHQSLHDPLTGLPNRALLLDRLRQGMARARRDGTTLAVLFCDMDDFKYVNDTLGHDAGDRLLSALAPRLAAALRTTDTLARFGGDEFVALCEGLTGPAEVIVVAERLLDAAADAVDLGGTEFVPTASIGIALAASGGDSDPEALLRDADVAMYGAKSRGKGRYELFDTAMRQETIERVGLLGDLRHAVPRGELVIAFQPIVSLRRREVAGLEALVRWRHPTRGLLMPDQFIALAEDSSLIQELGRWVIDEAVARTAAWQRAGVPVLDRVMTGVNVSWRQISHGTLVADVRDALQRHQLDPASLCVEITESAIMEDPDRSQAVLGELAQMGVHLGLDDFGTGHSSLAVLRNFPFDAIKLDRSFLAGEDWAVVRAVTQMARSLDLLVVAEGVERLAQEQRAAELGCDFGQGWLYAPALSAEQLEPAVLELESMLRGAH
jgi:diguanylate cyclase (GGDEF)-like protein/PAS domain S-box-containing protein